MTTRTAPATILRLTDLQCGQGDGGYRTAEASTAATDVPRMCSATLWTPPRSRTRLGRVSSQSVIHSHCNFWRHHEPPKEDGEKILK
jgi:hypothetical protein